MTRLFLLGGGDNEAGYVRTYWRFVQAASAPAGRRIAIVVPEPEGSDRRALEARWRAPFQLFDPVKQDECRLLFVSASQPLSIADLAAADPTGVIVADGQRELLYRALCLDASWTDWLRGRALPCAGVGSGAAVLAARFAAGGWLLPLLHANVEVAPTAAAEGLDMVELRDGLGLVAFALETAASQRGGLVRLLHLVAEGAWNGGWALDEGCMLEIDEDGLRVAGANGAFRATRMADGAVRLESFRAGAVLSEAG
jgi:cyanophycinase